MKTTINLRDALVKDAQRATGVFEKTALVHLGLQELVDKAARKRLAALGGSHRFAQAGRRRRPTTKAKKAA